MLNKLNEWTIKWHMKINATKSKIVHFRKSHIDRCTLKCMSGNTELHYEQSYKYLGVTFHENLKYNENATVLSDSGNRALGAIVAKYKKNNYMGYSTFTKLYESCVCPIVDYSSGVWGFEDFQTTAALQNKAQRIFLGVHKFAPILALEGDMGWLEPRYRRWLEIIRLWNRLISLPENRLTKKIFNNDYVKSSQGVNNWCSKMNNICKTIEQTQKFIDQNWIDLKSAKAFLINKQESRWKRQLPLKPKLRFYIRFKESLTVESYVKYNLSPSQRSLTAQFRMGILPLEVETGRFQGNKLEERICKLCNTDSVEDEFHFLFDCPLYNDIRNDLFNEVLLEKPDFIYLDTDDQCKILFSTFHRKLAKYIHKAFNIRKNSLFM